MKDLLGQFRMMEACREGFILVNLFPKLKVIGPFGDEGGSGLRVHQSQGSAMRPRFLWKVAS